MLMQKFCSAVEELSYSRKVRDGKLEDAIYEILEKAADTLSTQRVNAWLFNADHSEIQCIGNFDSEQHRLISQANLMRIAMPNYFRLFETEKVIHTPNAQHHPKTAELLESYLIPNGILSLLDIPLRIDGQIIGVVCFEDKRSEREWSEMEQNFGTVIAQFICLAVESHNRVLIRQELEKTLENQKLLMQEIHHRVKNNLTIVSSLLNLQSEKAKDDYHYQLFQEAKNRLNSIATLHQLLYQSQSYTQVDFHRYLEEILENLIQSFNSKAKHVHIVRKLQTVVLDVTIAIPMALIVNELITNAFKHAFAEGEKGEIRVELEEKEGKVILRISDNGKGFDPKKIVKSSVGLDILDALIDQINAKMHFRSDKGSSYEISLNKV